ncbi:MAG: zf-HC2 domain-containing protein [Acidobacteriota bacterium]|nr:zf-HC2 domain-containing protein [Acidobacteriota bacterium]MDE3162785.1 zf-HC2 domain-containing protein [Acidobacteriota bacterium]
MPDRTHIPQSPACGQWETLLADALDGLLTPDDQATFDGHMAACPACTALYEEARRGREWLGYLSSEPEIPSGLLDKILAQTGPGQVAGYGLVTSHGEVVPVVPAWQRPGPMGFVRRFAEPRLLMTAAMMFFSIALTLNLTGVRVSDFRLANLRPSAMRSFMERRLTMASTPIIRYYDHLRLVYEVESSMRELRRTAQGENQEESQPSTSQPATPGESQQTPLKKDGGTRAEPPQQSGTPATNDSLEYLETSLTLQDRPAHHGGSAKASWERSNDGLRQS